MISEVFHALGEPTRQEIVRRLALQGPQTLGRLVGGLPVTRQAATRHLYVLRDAGVVNVQKLGREQRCELQLEAVRAAEMWLRELENVWDIRMNALKDLLDKD